MTEPLQVNVTRRGVVTLPKPIREKYGLERGDVLTLIDLDGTFVFARGTLETDRLSEKIRERLEEQGESLETVLEDLRSSRESG
jgi:AbrB family looped-hinge helix DNA binding protein